MDPRPVDVTGLDDTRIYVSPATHLPMDDSDPIESWGWDCTGCCEIVTGHLSRDLTVLAALEHLDTTHAESEKEETS